MAAKPPQVYLVGHIRKIWRWSLKRRQVLRDADKCYVCHEPSGEYQADHVIPVGPAPLRGWTGWDEYLQRMFEGELKAICKKCHKEKTSKERKENAKRKRAMLKREPKPRLGIPKSRRGF